MQLENTFTVPAGIDEAWAAFNDPRRVAPCFPGATLDSYENDSFTGTVKVKLGPVNLTYKGKGSFVERDEAARKLVIDASGRDARGGGTASATVTGTMTADGDSRTTVTMVTDMKVTGRPAQFGRGVMADVSDKIVTQFAECLANKLGNGGSAAPAGAEPEAKAETETRAEPPAAAGAGGGGVATESSAGVVEPDEPLTTASSSSPVPAPAPTPVSAASGAPAPSAAATNGAAKSSSQVHGEVEAINLLDTAGAPMLKRLLPVAAGLVALLVVLKLVRSRRG